MTPPPPSQLAARICPSLVPGQCLSWHDPIRDANANRWVWHTNVVTDQTFDLGRETSELQTDELHFVFGGLEGAEILVLWVGREGKATYNYSQT